MHDPPMWGWFESPARRDNAIRWFLRRGPQRFMLACAPVAVLSSCSGWRGDRDGLRRADHSSGGLERRPDRVVALAAAVSCALTARRKRAATPAGLDAAGALRPSAGAAGRSIWTWYESVLGRDVPFPSLADVGYLGAVPFAAAALLSASNGRAEPGRARPHGDRRAHDRGLALADELGTRARPIVRGRRRHRPLAGDQPRLPDRRRGRRSPSCSTSGSARVRWAARPACRSGWSAPGSSPSPSPTAASCTSPPRSRTPRATSSTSAGSSATC